MNVGRDAGLTWLLGLFMCGDTWALERPESTRPDQNYVLFCAGCHRPDGSGVSRKVPSLHATLPLLLRTEGGREYVLRVPGVSNSALTDKGVAQVLNWAVEHFVRPEDRATWAPFTPEAVRAARRLPLPSVRAARREAFTQAGVSNLPEGEDGY